MTWTYTAGASSRDYVRMKITDTDSTNPIFTDEELDAFLVLESNSVLCASAAAAETIAVSEVLVQKRIKLLDLSTDGPAEANALRALAVLWRDQAKTAAETFDIAEMPGLDQFAGYEYIIKEAQRSG